MVPVSHCDRYSAPQVGEVPPDMVHTFYNYNLDRQLESIVRPDGTTIGMIYDIYKEYEDPERTYSGKLMKITVPGRGDISLTYETTGGKKLDTILTPEGNGLAYDYTGALLATESWSGEVTGTVGRTYNNDFRVSALTVNGVSTAYTYDNDGLLTGAGNLAVTRDPQSGLVTGTTLDTILTAQTYTSFGELAHYEAGTLYSYDFTERDKLGRIVEKVETIDGLAKTYRYGYDEAGRLETVWENGLVTGTYGYDENGNRLSHGGVAATYDDQDRMMTYGAYLYAYTYTLNGDLSTKIDKKGTSDPNDDELTTYVHDDFGNLTSVTLPDDTVISYVYDGRNRLIARKTGETVDYKLIYAGQLAPVAKLAPNDSVIETYVYAMGSNSPDYIVNGGVNYRVIKDHLGSMRMIVKSDGTVVQQIEYNEFGIATIHYPSNTIGDIFGFAGGIRDTDTGLTKFGARWYDPYTGRWLEKEPLGFRGSYNFYNYCDGDPVNYYDPTGLKKKEKISPDYDSEDIARAAARAEFNNPENKTNKWEYAVSLFKRTDGKYFYMLRTNFKKDYVETPIGPGIIEAYHNHADGSVDFSDGEIDASGKKCPSADKDFYDTAKRLYPLTFNDFFLVLPDGTLKSYKYLYDTPSPITPIDDIWK